MNQLTITDAFIWGTVSISGIVAGSLLGVYSKWGHKKISLIMALGAGLLIAAATVELAAEAFENLSSFTTGIFIFLAGAILFSLANNTVNTHGARNRKRCAECVERLPEEEKPGNGLAILIGTVMDAIPEALVLGVTLQSSGIVYPLIFAISIGNFPEALASSEGMLKAGNSRKKVFFTWTLVAIVTIILTGTGFWIARYLNHDTIAMFQLFGAGAMISLLTETIIPEVTNQVSRFAGLLFASGFVLYIIINHL